MSADSYVMCYFKANIQLYFVNVSVQRRKAVCVGCVVYLDVLVIGCIVYLAELVMIGLGIRLRQGFADRDCGQDISRMTGFIQR